MSTEEVTGGMRSDGLAGLLRIGLEADEGRAYSLDEKREARLRAALAGALPPGTPAGSALPGFGRAAPAGSVPLANLLLGADTPLSTLRWIKEYAKALPAAAEPDTRRAVATTLYFAAIAAALRFHGEKITTHGCADLAEHFGSLVEKRWMDPKLVKHFAAAQELCLEETL